MAAAKKSIRVTCGYMAPVYNFDALLAEFQESMEGVKFDTLVGTGLSGTIVTPRLAEAVGANWLVIRKKGDGSHSSKAAEGDLGKRWVFVDDFLSTGSTYRRVCDAVDVLVRYYNEWERFDGPEFRTKHVGAYSYRSYCDWEQGFLPASDPLLTTARNGGLIG